MATPSSAVQMMRPDLHAGHPAFNGGAGSGIGCRIVFVVAKAA